MSSEDPRERAYLCGRELELEGHFEDLAEKFDPGTWYEAEDGRHYCCREAWEGAEDGQCIWHADVADKPADELVSSRSNEPARLHRAVLRDIEFPPNVDFVGCRLWEADLGDADLRSAEFGNADLQGADFGGANLTGADFGDANLRRANLAGAALGGADLGEAALGGADLGGANLHVAEFGDAVLVGADFGGANLRRANLAGADLRGADFAGAELYMADLRYTELHDADLRDTDLEKADLCDADLQKANLKGANLHVANLGDTALSDADLGSANLVEADLGGANLGGADLGGADLMEADLGGTNLHSADLGDADLRNVDLRGADLRHSDLTDTDFRGTDLTGCKLHHTTFEEATLDETTRFGASSGFENDADQAVVDESRLARYISSRLRALGRPFTDPDPLEKAETQYRTIQRLKREHDLKQDINLEIQEKQARRKRALAERRYWDWFKLAFYRWPMGYGEKPGHVVGTSLVVIAASTLAYQLFAPVARTPAPDSANVIGGALLSSLPITPPPWVGELLTSLYFSVVTFTTLGYGDLQPASGAAQAVATLESFLGALLMALLVFVLGRRATW